MADAVISNKVVFKEAETPGTTGNTNIAFLELVGPASGATANITAQKISHINVWWTRLG